MKQTGELLRKARENKGVSITQVSLATKINPKTIEAIEAGDLENLPPKSFLRGFVRSYAQFLNINVESVLDLFHEEMGSTKPPIVVEDQSEAQPIAEEEKAPVLGGLQLEGNLRALKRVAVVVAVALLLGGIFSLKRKMDSYQEEGIVKSIPDVVALPEPAESEEKATDENLEEESSTQTAPNSEQGQTSSSEVKADQAKPSAGAAPVEPQSPPAPTAAKPEPPVPQPVAKPESTPAPAPAPKPEPAPAPQPVAKPEPTPTPAPAPKPAPAQESATTPTRSLAPQQGERELVIEALGPVQVEWVIQGKTNKVTMGPDEVRTIRSRYPIKVRISDGGAVNLSRNGRDLGVPGSLGKRFEGEY